MRLFIALTIVMLWTLTSSLLMQSTFRTRLSFVLHQNFPDESVDDEKEPMFSMSYDPLGNYLLNFMKVLFTFVFFKFYIRNSKSSNFGKRLRGYTNGKSAAIF